MGWWNAASNGDSLCEEPTGLVWGDDPADALSRALGKDHPSFDRRLTKVTEVIRTQFKEAFNRLPTKEEVVAGVLFSLGPVREFIDSLPDGPAPFPGWTLPGMLNVGPVSEEEMEGLKRFMLKGH